MIDYPERYYRDSGAVPFGGTVLMLVCGIVTAAVLSFIYAFLDYYNPFIYVTFLATAVVGLGVGMAVNVGATLGKVRSPLYARLVGVLSGFLAVYLCWAFYLWAAQMAIEELPVVAGFQEAKLSFDPSRMYAVVQVIAENGLWSIFGGTPTGWGLYAIWLVEAAIIFGAAVIVATGNDKPFCEECSEWTGQQENLLSLENTDFAQLRTDLEEERYERIDELCTGAHEPANCLRATLFTCPKCDNSNYLTIQHVVVTLDKDGDEQKEETEIVKRLAIPHELVTRLNSMAENVPAAPSRDLDEPLESADEDRADAEPTRDG